METKIVCWYKSLAAYQEETVVNEWTFLACMFLFLSSFVPNCLPILYISPSHSLILQATIIEKKIVVVWFMDQAMDASYPENATDSNNINSSYPNASSENFTDDAWASFSDSYHKEVRRVRVNFHSC